METALAVLNHQVNKICTVNNSVAAALVARRRGDHIFTRKISFNFIVFGFLLKHYSLRTDIVFLIDVPSAGLV